MFLAASVAAFALAAAPAAPSSASGADRFVSFCYHDVLKEIRSYNREAVDLRSFIQQIELMRDDGAHFISIEDILQAKAGARPLPSKAVLMTFDDACQTFHRNVFPLLLLYRIPAVLFVATSWPDDPPDINDCEGGKTMSWDEIREVARSGLVEIGSHTHELHEANTIHPLGSTAAAIYRSYDPRTGGYETEEQLRERLAADFKSSAKALLGELGQKPRALAWPYGAYHHVAVEEARRAGFQVLFHLDAFQNTGLGDLSHLEAEPRFMLEENPQIETFARSYWAGGPVPHLQAISSERMIHADLDLLYDPDTVVLRKNVDRFIERTVSLKPTAVYLQAFCDLSGTGIVSEVYFPNRILPVKADLFGFVSRSLIQRGVAVYAWMPVLGIALPTSDVTEDMYVRKLDDGKRSQAHALHRRLSPFSDSARQKVAALYEDLARTGPLSGVLFQDDAFLAEDEDFGPAAEAELASIVHHPVASIGKLSREERRDWTALKTRQLIVWTQALMEAVRRFAPGAAFARTLYAPSLLNPESEAWFAQNYRESLRAYDRVVVMAYPLMEQAANPSSWLRKLVDAARVSPVGIDRTVFKLQAVDWEKKQCVPSAVLRGWMRTLVDEGAKHIAYYPDNLFEDCPKLSVIREIMSTETFPFSSARSSN